MESQTTPTAEQLVDATGESLNLLERVLDGVPACDEAKDFVGVRLHMFDAERLPVLTMELVDLLEQIDIDEPDLYDSRHKEMLAVVDGAITPGPFAKQQRAHRVERRSTTSPWDGWPGSLLAFAGVYSLLTFLSIKLGADIGAPIMAAFLAGAIVLLTALHLRANWVGTLALSLVVAIPWFIATVVINAVMFPPY